MLCSLGYTYIILAATWQDAHMHRQTQTMQYALDSFFLIYLKGNAQLLSSASHKRNILIGKKTIKENTVQYCLNIQTMTIAHRKG